MNLNNGQTFRVYECGSDGPVCFFLHGGGFSALSWAVLSVSYCYHNEFLSTCAVFLISFQVIICMQRVVIISMIKLVPSVH